MSNSHDHTHSIAQERTVGEVFYAGLGLWAIQTADGPRPLDEVTPPPDCHVNAYNHSHIFNNSCAICGYCPHCGRQG